MNNGQNWIIFSQEKIFSQQGHILEDILKSGIIKKGGSAYERLQQLRGTTDKDKAERLRKFLRKQEEKKNGSQEKTSNRT